MQERMLIDGELHEISPGAWGLFKDFWGDKAYRQAGFVAAFERLVRELVADEIRGHAEDDWPLAGPRAAREAADLALGEWCDPGDEEG